MDINLIKQKLASLQGQSKQKSLIWKPKPGKTVIRILPYKHRPDNPFLELYFYYDVTKRTTLSPVTHDKPDPIYEFSQKLRAEGSTESYKLSKQLEPKMRTYVPILVRGEESEGPKFWGFGKTVYEELLKTMADDDYGDITDPKNGMDITVEFEKATGPGTYPKTSIRVKPKTSPVTTDKDVLELIKDMTNIDDIWELPTYEFLESKLLAFMNNEQEEEVKAAPPANAHSNTADAVDDLFGDTPTPATEAPAPAAKISTEADDFDDIFNS